MLFDEETWRFINTFAPWLSAFGTIAAVILSLYLARSDKRIKLDISAGHRIIVIPGNKDYRPNYLYIHIVNIGHREVQIVNIGWKIGFFKIEQSIQTLIPNDGMSSQMPIRLKDGEEAKYFIPLDEEPSWIREVIDKSLQPNPKIRIRFMKLHVFTSVGNEFTSRIEKGLKNHILKNLK